jgi:hypothetical protein
MMEAFAKVGSFGLDPDFFIQKGSIEYCFGGIENGFRECIDF